MASAPEISAFFNLLETPGASYDDLNKLCRGTNANMCPYWMDDGF